MARYWAMRTDKSEAKRLYEELVDGRLRQGWGYAPEQDLSLVAAKLGNHDPLTDTEKEVTRHMRMLESSWDPIKDGDVILLPNLPAPGKWSLAEVTGPYSYSWEPEPQRREWGDHNHVRPVKLLNPGHPINPYSAAVSAGIRGTMRCQCRLWSLDSYSRDIEALLDSLNTEPTRATKAIPEEARLLAALRGAREALHAGLRSQFHGAEFEFVCERVLRTLYDEVRWTGGRAEAGADFLCAFTDKLGIRYTVAVQAKMWEGEGDWRRPLDQIAEAYEHHEKVTAGLIISTAWKMSPGFEKDREKLESKIGIPIKVVCLPELLGLIMGLPEAAMMGASDAEST